MSDLRSLASTLADRGEIVTPPLEAVARRARRVRARRTTRNVALALVVVLLAPTVAEWVTNGEDSSHVRLVDRTNAELPPAGAMQLGSPQLGPVLPAPRAAAAPTTTTTTTTTAPPPPPPSCEPGRNGGRTDRGVTATSIKIVMTETLHPILRRTTVDASVAVKELVKQVNRLGGICGRLIDLHLGNETWGPLPWHPDAEVFAGIAGPLDDNLDHHVRNGDVDRSEVPVVGAYGTIGAHHMSPWVWPLGVTTKSLTRIALRHARENGADSIGLAFDPQDVAGREAAAAFDAYMAQYPEERTVVHTLGDPGDPLEAANFFAACARDTCDAVLLAMPHEKLTEWLANLPTGANPPLAVVSGDAPRKFWEGCPKDTQTQRCDELVLWSSVSRAFAMSWESDCELATVEVDGTAIVGACILLEAIRELGPVLTRTRLREVVDDITERRGLVAPMVDGRRTYRPGMPGPRARGMLAQYGMFDNYEGLVDVTEWVSDPQAELYPD